MELPFRALFAGGSEGSTAGTFAPGSALLLLPLSLVGAKVLGSKSSRGEAKVPQLELSLPGANGLGSEKSSSRMTSYTVDDSSLL